MPQTTAQIEQTVAHLFRHEWGKLVAVLTKLFGPQNLQLAEDVVQDTLLKAFHTWKINGLPQNPSAWLFTVARNKAVDVLRQQKRQSEFSKSITPMLQSEYTLVPMVKDIINTNTINDDQLRMMLVCCHPALPADAQVCLILKTLCGFSVTEIAKAFVCSYDTIEKRLYRARQSFKEHKVQFELPPAAALEKRLDSVLVAVYLLFNEGYNSTEHNNLIRSDLITEAIRLCELILQSNFTGHSAAHALMALMCFTASRSKARLNEEGDILLLKEQDRSRWDKELIAKGVFHLEASSVEGSISKYHFEAGIAYEYTRANNYASTNWQNILECYNLLQQYYPSPVVELNRAIVIGELKGAAAALKAVEEISQPSALKKYYLLPATLGELHLQLKNYPSAKLHFEEAILLTHSAAEKKLLKQKLSALVT